MIEANLCHKSVCVHGIYHLVSVSRASSGNGYEERVRISTETTEPVGFFKVKFFTWYKKCNNLMDQIIFLLKLIVHIMIIILSWLPSEDSHQRYCLCVSQKNLRVKFRSKDYYDCIPYYHWQVWPQSPGVKSGLQEVWAT